MLENRNVIRCLHLYVLTMNVKIISAVYCICVTTISGVISQMVKNS